MVNWTDDKGSSFLATFLVFDFSFLAPSHISRFIGSSVTLSDFNYVGVSGPGPSGMRNFTPVRYGTVFLQNPGIPVFFGTV